MRVAPRVVVAGLGNAYRRDDGAGPAIAAEVSGQLTDEAGVELVGPLGDPLDLLGLWDGADLAVVIDAVGPDAVPGAVHVEEVAARPAGGGVPKPVSSTHGIDLAGVLRLAAAVGRAPARVVVVGIAGADFGRGEGLSPAVQAAVPEAARRAVEVIRGSRPCA